MRPWEAACWDCGVAVDCSRELDAEGEVAQPVRCRSCCGGQATTAEYFSDRIPTAPDGVRVLSAGELDLKLRGPVPRRGGGAVSRPALQNGAPWLEAGDRIEVLTPVGWVEVTIRCQTDDPDKYPGYAHFDFGQCMSGCVAPWTYGEHWRLPAAFVEAAVGL